MGEPFDPDLLELRDELSFPEASGEAGADVTHTSVLLYAHKEVWRKQTSRAGAIGFGAAADGLEHTAKLGHSKDVLLSLIHI